MKEKLVGTRVGKFLLGFNRWQALRGIPLHNPEGASTTANAILADRLIQRLCTPKGTFLDVGAHIGSVFSSVHLYDRTVQIVAVEADPGKAESLRQKFPYCKVLDVAVGDEVGHVEFFINPSATGYNSLVPDRAGNQRVIRVPISRLDDLLPDVEIDLIKIDVEGAELGALRGGKLSIERNRPTIMFESCGTGINALGYSSEQLWQWFHEMGYLIFAPDRLAHDAPPLTLEVFLDAHFYPFRTQNFFAVHRERRTEIRDKARKILRVLSV